MKKDKQPAVPRGVAGSFGAAFAGLSAGSPVPMSPETTSALTTRKISGD